MANIKSQKKRILTAEKARMRNKAIKSELKTAVRAVREAVAAGNGVEAYVAAQKACRLLDKAATKGVIHKNQAANRKSGVMKLANTIVTPEDIAAAPKPVKKENVIKGGTKKAAKKAAKAEAYAAAAAAKAERRAATEKAQAAAAARKAAEAAEAAAEEEAAE
ncbi:30S ribosomal protein S20 [Slackia heliotrinireducens]|uniref:30S ribosomal protein S20 n=1 Tax=Slackia heliotrinireducens TaxID=84110 RepID=UPI003315C208